jgi:serine/threonine-protein kinase
MNESHDPDRTVDVSCAPADSLDAGLAAGFGRPAAGSRSILSELRDSLGDLRPVLLRQAEGESTHVVKPKSDAMPPVEVTGDRYRLDGEIARGGMGAVLRGRDVDLGRDLAVKVLLEKYAQRPEVARRFIEEAQIGGQLQHPGVVPVYDIGRFGDRPFFTMKLVKGQTLAALLGQRADPAADRPRLLTIALQVAQTLAYAHAKGVIHRDLKPANVMVGAFGEVQVMDWGLAKVLAAGGIADEEKASRAHQVPQDMTTIRTARSSGTAGSYGTDTEAGSLLGTPAYMPPEQANGDVAALDRRADVFGLGAILCEILTGKPPYLGRSYEEVRRKAANGDLADARSRLEACGADAELIALTIACLSPEAIDRPKDARVVADSLTAYLDGVQARLHQAELAEAAAKAKAAEEAKRRRLTVALAATVLVALVLGGGGWLWLKADRDARQAKVAREVNDAVNRATALREQARAATAGRAALFAQAREQAQRALALAESGPADAALLARVRELQEEEKDDTLLAALDAAHLAQAQTMAGQGGFNGWRGVQLIVEALRDYGLLGGEGEPEAAAQRIRQRPAAVRAAIVDAVDEWIELGANTRYSLRGAQRDWLEAVVAAAQPADGWMQQFRAARQEQDEARRRAALEKLAEAADVSKLPAGALARLSRQLRQLQATASAAALLRRARQQYPADFWVNQHLGMALHEAKAPHPEEAVRFLTAAVALRPDSAGTHNNLGLVLQDAGQLDEAIACYRKAMELEPFYSGAHNNLGNVLRVKGPVDEAIACYRKAIELAPDNGKAHSNLGAVLCDVKRDYDGAVTCFRRAIALDPRDAIAHHNLGEALTARGEVDEAIASYRKATEIDPKFAPAQSHLLWAERLAVARNKLPAFQNGSYKPGTIDERLALAEWCQIQRLHRIAADLYVAAFAADPKRADDLSAGHRYKAACRVARAATREGEAAGKLNDRERARLRQLALDWLHADLALRGKELASGQPAERIATQQELRRWQQDSDLAGLRDPAALGKLPPAEREACTQLWADLAALLKRAER